MKVTRSMVSASLMRWRKRLEIDPKWRIAVTIYEQKSDTPEGFHDSLAFIDPDVATWSAALGVNAWHIETAKDLDETLCHETLHLIVDPIATALTCAFGDRFEKMGNEMVESLTETLARALTRAYARR